MTEQICHECGQPGATNSVHHQMTAWFSRFYCDDCIPEIEPAAVSQPTPSVTSTRQAHQPSAPKRTPTPLPPHRNKPAAEWGAREIDSWLDEWERDDLIDDLQAEGAKR